MFIKRLTIIEKYPVKKKIREINFVKGMNFIVDGGKDQEKGNSVGKTTILKLIDICLGSRDKKYLYYDDETKHTNERLKNYIIDNKIYAELTVEGNFNENESKKTKLKVELYPRGKRYINGVEKNINDYWNCLNNIFFLNEANKPSFRQLINMFVRINQRNDNNKFLKFLTRTDDETYKNIYAFLFNLKNQEISNEILKLRQEIKQKQKEIKNFMSINKFHSIDSISQKIKLLSTTILDLNKQVNILIDSKKFKENEEKISEVKVAYANYNNQIDRLLFKRKRVEDILKEAKKEVNNEIDKSVLKHLYDETKGLIGKLDKEFEDLMKFNNELIHNKLNYFNAQKDKIDDEISILKSKQHRLFEKHKNIIMLIEENKIDEYSELQKKIAEYNEEIGSNKNIKETYNQLENSLDKSKKKLEDKEEFDNNEETLTIFNKYFAEYSEKTNGDSLVLYSTTKGFPLAIDNVKSGFSTGTRKSIIAAFDLAYQSFCREIRKTVPNFIIHDVIETLDKVSLNAIIKIVDSLECQYIVAVLKEKIEGSDLIKDSNIIVTLSENNKPFKN
ncbi:hypothetical protein ACWEZE_10400 [Staphylococcus shinii]|uniref:hypothetical protein n=1 Tax=Staphylococcus shinii TaxID=2912228 RepID=UPI000C31BA0B|nr:hypothetical protein [Staphylococcus shinii]PKI09331.1 hypothetical protein CW747_09595 [Staphylococcus shinii]